MVSLANTGQAQRERTAHILAFHQQVDLIFQREPSLTDAADATVTETLLWQSVGDLSQYPAWVVRGNEGHEGFAVRGADEGDVRLCFADLREGRRVREVLKASLGDRQASGLHNALVEVQCERVFEVGK